MNKILVDGDKLHLSSDIDSIEVNGYATIFINDLCDIKLDIKVSDGSILNIFDFTTKSKDKEIYIYQSNNTKVSYVHTFKVSNEYKLKYRAILNGDNNTNDISISGVSKSYVSLDVDGCVKSSTKNNILNENIKVLTIDGNCFVAPQLHVSAKEVLANHNTAISNIREDELFYLAGKGIDKNKAIKLLEDGYVYGYLKKYNQEFYDLIKG